MHHFCIYTGLESFKWRRMVKQNALWDQLDVMDKGGATWPFWSALDSPLCPPFATSPFLVLPLYSIALFPLSCFLLFLPTLLSFLHSWYLLATISYCLHLIAASLYLLATLHLHWDCYYLQLITSGVWRDKREEMSTRRFYK
eukprot:c17701_g2_i3 orf=64-489(-)